MILLYKLTPKSYSGMECQQIYAMHLSMEDLKAVDTDSFPEIEGKYSYIKKEEQEYRRHTRTKTEKYKDANGKTRTRTKTETYWSWDTMRTERTQKR